MTPSPNPKGDCQNCGHEEKYHQGSCRYVASMRDFGCGCPRYAPPVQEEAKICRCGHLKQYHPQHHGIYDCIECDCGEFRLAPTPTIELDELIGNCIPHLNEEGASCAIYKGKPCNCGIDELKAALQSHIADQVREARINELEKAFDVDTIPFVPVRPCGDCIGIYEYAQDRITTLKGETKK